MNLKHLIGKKVVLQFKMAYAVVCFDKSSQQIAPLIVGPKEKEQAVQMPFIVGVIHQDEGSNDFWLEYSDATNSGSTLRLDFSTEIIGYATSLLKEPSRLIS